MRGLIVAGVLLVGGGAAWANPISDVGNGTVTTVKFTGEKAGEIITWAVVGTDRVLEWTNSFLHDKVVHPAVEALTLGTVSL